VAGYLLAGSLFAIKTPAWQNPDEPAHYNNIATIARGEGLPALHSGDYDQEYQALLVASGFPPDLPIAPLRYEAYQPPLYYLAAAPVYWLSGGSLLTLRLFSVAIGAFVIILLYLCAELVFTNKPLLTVGAAAFAAFLPMQVAMSAAVNNDGLAQLLRFDEFDPDFDPRTVQGFSQLGSSGPAQLRFLYQPDINRVPPPPIRPWWPRPAPCCRTRRWPSRPSAPRPPVSTRP